MHAVTSALAKGDQLLSRRLAGGDGAGSDLFSSFFNNKLKSNSGDRIQEALDRISQRFPNLTVTAAENGTGVEGAAKTADENAGSADQATLSQSVLAGMLNNSELAKKVEDIIGAFLERASDSNLMNFEGASVQRSVSISITVVRYTELHYSQAGGDLLGGSDLKTNFHDRLAEMIRSFFDGTRRPGAETEQAEEETEAAKSTEKASSARDAMYPVIPMSGFTAWSLEIYYSSSYISSISNASGEAGQENSAEEMLQAWKFSASFSASFTRGFTNFIPQALLGVSGTGSLGKPGDSSSGSSSLFDFLQNMLAGFGMESGGFRVGADGYFINLHERRNLLNELMELYNSKLNQGAGSEAADAAAESAESAEVVDPATVA